MSRIAERPVIQFTATGSFGGKMSSPMKASLIGESPSFGTWYRPSGSAWPSWAASGGQAPRAAAAATPGGPPWSPGWRAWRGTLRRACGWGPGCLVYFLLVRVFVKGIFIFLISSSFWGD